MIYAISAVSVIAYLIILFTCKGKPILQQVLMMIVYILGLTRVGSMDVLLPLYFLASSCAILGRLRKISTNTGLLALYFIVYLIVGICLQKPARAISTFISRNWQMLVFFLVFDSEIREDNSDLFVLMIIGVVVESFLGIYLLNTGIRNASTGLVRLVFRAQPITGSITTAMLTLVALHYVLSRDRDAHLRSCILLSLVSLMWVILSGTRGYTLVYALTMILLFYDYFIHAGHRVGTRQTRNILFLILIVLVLCISLFLPNVSEYFRRILRIRSSTGIRSFENDAIRDMFLDAPIHIKLFGIGIGGVVSDHSSLLEALQKQFAMGMWDRSHYLYDGGAIFHSLYANMLLNYGLIGILVQLGCIVGIWRRITRCCSGSPLLRKVLHMYLIAFLLMNRYRWACTCGIAEMIILALVLKRFQTNEKMPSRHMQSESTRSLVGARAQEYTR